MGRWLFFVYRLHFLRGSYKHNNEIIIESGEKVPFENKRIADEIIDNELFAKSLLLEIPQENLIRRLQGFVILAVSGAKPLHCGDEYIVIAALPLELL